MSLRISSASLALALLGACGDTSPAPEGEMIACAIGQGADFAEDCTLERVAGGDAVILHHPDGGFRRMRLDPATGVPVAADGAESVVIERAGDTLQFAVGGDRYRIARGTPATPAP